jgi:hypothetical protein
MKTVYVRKRKGKSELREALDLEWYLKTRRGGAF